MVKKKLPIEYNSNLPIGIISDDPFAFLIHTRLFDNVRIVSDMKLNWLDELDLGSSRDVLNTSSKTTGDSKRLTQTKKFTELVKSDPKRKYIMYGPIDPPYKVNPLTFLMNSPTIAHAYENKRYFRDEFADLIRMPEYEIKYVDELDKAAAYKELNEKYGAFVMQDEESSGSKGTYIIKNHDHYVEAVTGLKRTSYSRSVVISKFIEGLTHSVQVCITKYGIFSSGVQKQLVDSEFLCNTKLQGATRWCGGELGVEYPDIVQHQATEMATIVGSELASHGYKGIFGIDIILTPENEVYAIEINARHTGYSHVISDMQLKQGKIPFMLLHVLELANQPYEVTDLDSLPSVARYKKPVSYLIINNRSNEPVKLEVEIPCGIYKVNNDSLEFIKSAISIDQLQGDNTILINCRNDKGGIVDPGKRILKITKYGKSMAKEDLNFKSQHVIKVVKKHFNLPE